MDQKKGKAGSMIREIQETSGAMIEVAEEDAQCTVNIKGGKGQRDKAIRMVGDLNNNQQSGFPRASQVAGVHLRDTSPLAELRWEMESHYWHHVIELFKC